MQKIVINVCYGGFGLSEEALLIYSEQKGIDPDTIIEWEIERDDKVLVEIVEKLGKDAGGEFAYLKIVEIPDDVNWEICEYDGNEHVAEHHRKWY